MNQYRGRRPSAARTRWEAGPSSSGGRRCGCYLLSDAQGLMKYGCTSPEENQKLAVCCGEESEGMSQLEDDPERYGFDHEILSRSSVHTNWKKYTAVLFTKANLHSRDPTGNFTFRNWENKNNKVQRHVHTSGKTSGATVQMLWRLSSLLTASGMEA
ncbi:hypothetical protein ZWY2020_038717 [Hordeum vulgare]|nr:hypothetical protein ZWY2020_038717 [Hordeum vulgare]